MGQTVGLVIVTYRLSGLATDWQKTQPQQHSNSQELPLRLHNTKRGGLDLHTTA